MLEKEFQPVSAPEHQTGTGGFLFKAINGASVEMRDDGGEVTFADGAKVVYDRGGICSVSRGGVVEKLHAPQYDPVKESKPLRILEI